MVERGVSGGILERVRGRSREGSKISSDRAGEDAWMVRRGFSGAPTRCDWPRMPPAADHAQHYQANAVGKKTHPSPPQFEALPLPISCAQPRLASIPPRHSPSQCMQSESEGVHSPSDAASRTPLSSLRPPNERDDGGRVESFPLLDPVLASRSSAWCEARCGFSGDDVDVDETTLLLPVGLGGLGVGGSVRELAGSIG